MFCDTVFVSFTSFFSATFASPFLSKSRRKGSASISSSSLFFFHMKSPFPS